MMHVLLFACLIGMCYLMMMMMMMIWGIPNRSAVAEPPLVLDHGTISPASWTSVSSVGLDAPTLTKIEGLEVHQVRTD